MEVEPKSVVQTSPDTFADDEKIFISMYPRAREETDIRAIAASPFIFRLSLPMRSSMAAPIVTGMVIRLFEVRCRTEPIAIAPNATWERPSPIKEYRLSTRVTPRSEEQSAIRVPTINAYFTKGY